MEVFVCVLVMCGLIGIGIGWNRVIWKESESASESGFWNADADADSLNFLLNFFSTKLKVFDIKRLYSIIDRCI